MARRIFMEAVGWLGGSLFQATPGAILPGYTCRTKLAIQHVAAVAAALL
jgi:hypothetical protein